MRSRFSMRISTSFANVELHIVATGNDGSVAEAKERWSERYLQAIENIVAKVGGWEKIDTWDVEQNGGSFTGLRSLVVLVNALAALHDIPVYEMVESKRAFVQLPLEVRYSSEPNISEKR